MTVVPRAPDLGGHEDRLRLMAKIARMYHERGMRRAGAVGDICLRFFDGEGRAVVSEVDARVVGIDPGQLRDIGRRVGVAGGARKHTAIRAALLGGWINVLITDLDEARRLLDHDAA